MSNIVHFVEFKEVDHSVNVVIVRARLRDYIMWWNANNQCKVTVKRGITVQEVVKYLSEMPEDKIFNAPLIHQALGGG